MAYFPYEANVAGALTEEFARLAGGTIDKLKLMKLMYLLDRTALIEEGYAIIGGTYYAMPRGPVISEFYDDLDSGKWENCGIHLEGYNVHCEGAKLTEYLSEWSKQLAKRIYDQYKSYTGVQLAELLHKQCAEWKDPAGSSHKIAISDIPGCEGDEVEAYAQELSLMTCR